MEKITNSGEFNPKIVIKNFLNYALYNSCNGCDTDRVEEDYGLVKKCRISILES